MRALALKAGVISWDVRPILFLFPFHLSFVSLFTFPHDAYILIPQDTHISYSRLPLFTISYIYSLAWHPPIPQL